MDQLCEACLAGKKCRASFPKRAKFHAEHILELVHGDLCGSITPATPSGKRYFLLLVDDHNRFMWIHLLATKDRTLATIKQF